MIRALRNSGIGQFFLGLVVLAIILAFVLTGAAPTAGGGDDECVAQVGSEICVEPKEFEAAYRLLSAIGGGSINEAAAKRLRLRQQVARGLIERELLVDEAKRLKIGTSQDDIDSELLEGRTRISLPAKGAEQLAMSLAMCVNGPTGCQPGTIGLRAIDVKTDGQFDIERYKRTIRVWTRRSPNHFKEMQVLEYTAERMRQLIKSQVRVSEEEAFLAYERVRSKATARSVYAQNDWFERYVVDVDQKQVEAFEASGQEAVKSAVAALGEGFAVGCPIVSEIRVDAGQPGSEEAEAARKEAETLLRQLKAGKSFSQLARTESDADTARLGGRVGCLDEGYGAGAAVLIEAAKKLKKPGDLSPVVETIRGFTILRLNAQVSEENRQQLMKDYVAYKLALAAAADERARQFSERLIERASEQPLEQATEELVHEALGLEGEKTKPSGQDDHPALADPHAPRVEISRPVSADQDVIDAVETEEAATFKLFGLEKEDQVYEKPLKAEDGYVVLQLKSKEMLTREKFAEDRARIMETLWKRKAEQELADHIEDLLKKAGKITYNPKFVPSVGSQDAEKES